MKSQWASMITILLELQWYFLSGDRSFGFMDFFFRLDGYWE